MSALLGRLRQLRFAVPPAAPARRRAYRPNLECLEKRELLSAGTLRIAAYNMEADINGDTTPLPGFYQVLEGIGEEKLLGDVQPLDILTLEETTSNSTTVAPIVSALNSYYSGMDVYAQSPYQATQDGTNADGNGPNALVYNTTTLTLLASVGVGTPEGSANGEYRQVVRYEFRPVGDSGTTGVFYVYVSHMKSGSTSADATDRGEEATIIRNDEATLPANAWVLYTGDLNSAPPEAEFTEFTAAGQGEAYDPTNFSTSVQYYSESAKDLRYRDDYELMTSNVLNDAVGGIDYVSGTLHSFGNNGTTPSGGSVNSGSDTALNSDLMQDGPTFISASTLYSDLTTASDHLPVVADYYVYPRPSSTALQSTANPSVFGHSVTLIAVVSGSGATPTGTVTFLDGGSVLGTGTLNANGGASLTVSTFSAGTHALTAAYGGDSTFAASTSTTLDQVVNPASSTTTLTDNGPNPSDAGQAVSFTVNVSGGVPDGDTVILEDADNGNAQVGPTGTLASGSATVAVPAGALTVGTHHIFAVYGGDANYSGSQSGQTAQAVNAVNNIALSSVTVNGSTAPVIDATEDGSDVVTITTDGPAGFAANDRVLIAGVATGYDGAWTIGSVDTANDTFTYSASAGGLGEVTDQGTATDANASSGLLSGVQRSMVDSIVYVFNQAVNLSSSALSIAVHSGQPGTAPALAWASPDGGLTWVVTFNGASVTGNSIADGVYDVTVNNSQVTAVSGSGTLESNETDTFYRLYGDVNGDQIVNNGDNLHLKQTYLQSAGASAFNAWLDYNDAGIVNNGDNLQFKNDYLVSYSGFTPTI